jgi:hypothetical protein
MPYAAAAAGSGAVVGKPSERGRNRQRERELKVGNGWEAERKGKGARMHRWSGLTALWAGRWRGWVYGKRVAVDMAVVLAC